MKLFIHWHCQQIITKTCRKIIEIHPDLQPPIEVKFERLQNNFITYGSKLGSGQ